jgi:hypothetical protein
VRLNIIIPDNIKDSKKNIITLHINKILTTNTFTVINILLYKITFSLGILTMVNRSPDIQAKAYCVVISSLYIYTWVTGIRNVLTACNLHRY